MKLSYVLPVYNVERYLAKALDSIIAQNLALDTYEIIVVNDSSPDDSRAVAERFAATHPTVNLRIIDQVPNGGVGAARTLGIDNARGEYILSMDPDDYLDGNVMGKMIREMDKYHLDVLAFRCRGVDEQGERIEWVCTPKLKISRFGVITGPQYMISNQYALMVHQYLMRRDFVLGNPLRMLGHNVHEDVEFTPKMLSLARRVKHFPHEVYNYMRRDGSTMSSFGPNDITSVLDSVDSLNRFVKSGAVTDKKVVRHIRRVISHQLYMILRRNMRSGYVSQEELLEEVKRRDLLPMDNHRAHINRFLINHSTNLYLFYNRYIWGYKKKRE